MHKDNVIKVILWIQNSLGIIMCKFRAVKSKTEGMAASVRVFLNTPRISQGIKRGLAIQMGQTVPNFYRKKKSNYYFSD